MSSRRPARPRAGFTLAEVMVSFAVFIIVLTLTLGVVTAIAKISVKTEAKEKLNGDYRAMTHVIADIGRTANAFRIYSDYAPDHRKAASDALLTGQAGDFIVLVTYSTEDIGGAPNTQRIGRIVGIYRDGTGSGPEKLRWFDSERHAWRQTFSKSNPAPASATIEELLPPAAYHGPVLTGLAQGTAGGIGDSRGLFIKLNDLSFMLNGAIYRNTGDASTNTSGGQDAKSAYNLVVTPRS